MIIDKLIIQQHAVRLIVYELMGTDLTHITILMLILYNFIEHFQYIFKESSSIFARSSLLCCLGAILVTLSWGKVPSTSAGISLLV